MPIMERSFYQFLESTNISSDQINRLLSDKRARDFLFCQYIISDYSEIDLLVMYSLVKLSNKKEKVYA